MYRAILTASLLLAPTLAVAAPHCAAAPSAQTLPSEPRTAASPAEDIPSPLVSDDPHAVSADEISRVPALQRIASAGAHLTDLGTQHGLHAIFARNGKTFQVFYITPDGQGAVGGVMWDYAGHNITRQQVSAISGVIPTVTIGSIPPGPGALKPRVSEASIIRTVSQTAYGLTGSASAPRLWMFIDPACSFSIRAMEQLRPYIAAGKLQVAVIPLTLLDYEDKGQSTIAAKVMLSRGRDHMVDAWTSNGLTGEADAASGATLQANMAIQEALHVRGTPTFYWSKTDGSVGQSVGMPPDLDAMIASIATTAS